MSTRRVVVGSALALCALGIGVFGWSAGAGAEDPQIQSDPTHSELTGLALIQQLNLPEIPMSGYSRDVDCNYLIDWDGHAYCMDAYVGSSTDARLLADHIRGGEVTDELRDAVEGQQAMMDARTAYDEAVESGASEEQVNELWSAYQRALADYETARAAWEASSSGSSLTAPNVQGPG